MIRIEDLVVRFGRFEAVAGLSLEVGRGELFGFLGPNGAGKTTTIRVLTGALGPSSGSIHVAGEPIPRRFSRIKSRFGYVPDTEDHLEAFTGRENLELFARLYGAPPIRITAVLAQLELSDAAGIRVRDYSKGMKRKLLIARELLHEPELLYCDEPTANLDAHSTERVRELLLGLRARGTTVFLTTHDMEEVEQICDRVAILSRGKLVDCDTPAAFVRKHAEPRVRVQYGAGEGTARELFHLQDPQQREQLAECIRQHEDLRVHSEEFDFEDVFLKLTGEAYR